jgi:hypothetical protein
MGQRAQRYRPAGELRSQSGQRYCPKGQSAVGGT